MDCESWSALYEIFKMGGHKRQILLGTSDFGKLIGASQQTASRRLLMLVEEGYISRELTPKGQNIAMTEKGLASIREVYSTLKFGFEEGLNVVYLNGFVFSGFGEGAYYVTKSGYKEQFVEKLGFQPFPGTLNLKLRSLADIKARSELESMPGTVIAGFKNGERTYGDVKSFKVLINGNTTGAILMIHRTHYGQDVLEIVSEESLRKKLCLKDGDLVQLKVLLHEQQPG
jgi:riboflavin kinase